MIFQGSYGGPRTHRFATDPSPLTSHNLSRDILGHRFDLPPTEKMTSKGASEISVASGWPNPVAKEVQGCRVQKWGPTKNDLVYHFFGQWWLVLGVKLMEIGNWQQLVLFSRNPFFLHLVGVKT